MAGVPQRGYESRVDPSGAARLVQAPAEAFGTGVGAQLEQAGKALHQDALQARRIELERERDSAMSDAAVALTEAQGRLAAEEDALFEAMPEGGEGVESQLEERRTKILEGEFLSTIGNDKVREHFAPMVARIAIASRDRTRGVVVVAKAKKTKAGGQIVIGQGAHQMRTRPDGDIETVFKTLDTFADANIKDAATNADFKRKGRQEIVIAHARGIGDAVGGAAMLRYVSDDALAGVIEPEQAEALRGEAESHINRELVAADRQNREAIAAQREAEDTFITGASAGLPVDVAAGAKLAAQARSRGDTSKALQIGIHTESAAATNALQGALIPQITDAIAGIEAQPNWRDNPTLVIRHKAAVELRERKRKEEPNIAEPDWNDPASIGKYRQQVYQHAWANQIEPRFIVGDFGERLKDQIKTPQGRRAALETLARLGDRDGFSAAQQLAPDDRVFQLSATLQGRARDLALAGKDALPTIREGSVTSNAGLEFRKRAQPALRGFNPEYARAAQEGALAIYASMMQGQGKSGWDEDVYEQALNMALGASERGGGLGEWNDAPLQLPDDMGQAEFDRLLSRQQGLANAFDAAGKQLSWDQVRRHFNILTVGDGLYHFVDIKGQPVRARDGTPALLNIRTRR